MVIETIQYYDDNVRQPLQYNYILCIIVGCE